MPTKLTAQNLADAAKANGLETAALIAVYDVESGGDGFLPDGTVKILFERHILWQRLRTRGIDPRPLSQAKPGLCGANWCPRVYPYGAVSAQWGRVQGVIDWAQEHAPAQYESYKKAAYESCSYGLFQIMGMNYAACGFDDVYPFKHAMEAGEAQQLAIMLTWIKGNGLLKKLQAKDWVGFARGYNGPGQVAVYSGKLQAAYAAAKP